MIDMKMLQNSAKELSVLYVEIMQLITKELLSIYFPNIDSASHGQEGLDKYHAYYNTYQRYYDLVITDITMPIMDGVEMSEKIFNVNEDQVIISVTGHSDADFLIDVIDVGVSNFLFKPIDREKFVKVLKRCVQIISDRKFVVENS